MVEWPTSIRCEQRARRRTELTAEQRLLEPAQQASPASQVPKPVVPDARVWSPSAPVVLLTVGLAAVLARLAVLLRAPAFVIADSDNYYLPAYQLARGIGFDLDLRRTPGYPLFVALTINLLGEDLSALVFAQHLLGVGTCVLTAWLGLRLFGPWTGLLSGLLTASAAPLLVAEHYVMAEALFVPLLVATIAVLCWAMQRRETWPMLLGGALIGVSALTRPIGLVLLCAIVPALLVGEGRARVLPRALAALLGTAVVLVPWMSRNAVVHGSFSAEGNLGQTLVGRTMRHDRGFQFENSADADPARQRAREIMRDGRGSFVSPVRERIKRELGLADAEANGLMRDLAIEAVQRQPGYYVVSSLSNFGRLALGNPERLRDHWSTRRDSRNREEWESHHEIRHLLGPPSPSQERQYGIVDTLLNLYQPARLGVAVPTLALIGLAALLLPVNGGTRSLPAIGTLIGLTAIGLLAASAALVAPLPRYRYPVEPLINLLAAGGLSCLVLWTRQLFGRASPPRSEQRAVARKEVMTETRADGDRFYGSAGACPPHAAGRGSCRDIDAARPARRPIRRPEWPCYTRSQPK